ncbi:MAG: hypothetical protein HEEMFOPI_02016 [Holosporales bacterium]
MRQKGSPVLDEGMIDRSLGDEEEEKKTYNDTVISFKPNKKDDSKKTEEKKDSMPIPPISPFLESENDLI